ncbi:MAG: glycosyl transferase [Neisseria animaloris]|uniref:Uncharacterized protein n=1 Tax=Neisseria animaloris TaxID=326522 RepID=A0A448UBF6_9NEIS|nr:glycosyl transferase [Neisseria animaloris]MDO5073730.1 glycosyl transferase [Neisseria animaloris]VEJ21223.1 Uncharacterised protein [Neisseria animaloris]
MNRFKYIFSLLFSGAIILLLNGCSGSETYRGTWKAMDTNNVPMEIVFEEKQFTLSDLQKNTKKTYRYSQNTIQYENGKRRYGIQVENGASFSIAFPFQNDEERAMLIAPDNTVVMTLDRTKHLPLKDFWQLNR